MKKGDVMGTAKATHSMGGMHHTGPETRPEAGPSEGVTKVGPPVVKSGLGKAVRHLEKMGKNPGIHIIRKS